MARWSTQARSTGWAVRSRSTTTRAAAGPVRSTIKLPGLFDIQCDQRIRYHNYDLAQITNAGMLRKSSTTGTTTIEFPVNNSGTVEALAGTLRLNGGSNLGGTFRAARGGLDRIRGWQPDHIKRAGLSGTRRGEDFHLRDLGGLHRHIGSVWGGGFGNHCFRWCH